MSTSGALMLTPDGWLSGAAAMGKGPGKAGGKIPPPPTGYSPEQFFLEDYGRTLFPLSSNRLLVQHGHAALRGHIDDILAGNHNFLPQRRVYAAKDPVHVRRTVKLDPVAEFFIYDLIYRNRTLFRKSFSSDKVHYGYRFDVGRPVSASESYKLFKSQLWINSVLYENYIGFDLASYFNSLYHHDLVEWIAALGANEADVAAFGKFLRETNAGRSIDCLPHGLYPTKMIGNDFLRFVEEHHVLRSKSVVRFMDDIYIFSDDEQDVKADFANIQRLLGQRGLSVNPRKTTRNELRTESTETSVSDLKKKLLERRRLIVSTSFYEEDEPREVLAALDLSDEELEYISSILNAGDMEEEDAELILTVMRKHSANVEGRLPEIVERFPHLAKNVYRFCDEVENKELVADIVLSCSQVDKPVQEYQLFWFAMMLDGYLMDTTKSAAIIRSLFHHPNATDISKAKVLEIADARYGLPELRNSYLSSGQSDWLSWASAVGSRNIKPAARNYRLGYFMNSSPMNRLIGDIVKAM
jgi:hypothetical protein